MFTHSNFLLYILWRNLTIRGIWKKIKLDVEFGGIQQTPWGTEVAGFTLTGNMSRQNWHSKWNTALESGGILVSDMVTLICEVELMNEVETTVLAEK